MWRGEIYVYSAYIHTYVARPLFATTSAKC